MKKTVIALRIHHGIVETTGIRTKIKLPPGCLGIMMVFETKKAAREWWGKDVEFIEIELIKKEDEK